MNLCQCGAEIPAPAATGRPRKWCSDSCRKRAHDREIVAACRECGAGLTRHHFHSGCSGRCMACYNAGRARMFEARARIIADLWADGLSRNEIANEFGFSASQMAVEFDRIRRRFPGLLPYRYSLTNPRAQATA